MASARKHEPTAANQPPATAETSRGSLLDALKIALQALLLVLLTLLPLELLLQAAFPHLPAAVIERMPQYEARMGFRLDAEHGAREYPASQRVEFEVDEYSGDLFTLSCLGPEDAQPVRPYSVRFTRDHHGFRNPTPWPDDIELAILGDSFTAAELINEPFWQDMSDSMLVFGLPGSGALEQQRLFNAFALPRRPETVLIAFFSGNDLEDSERFHAMLEAGETWSSRQRQGKNPLDYSVFFRLLQALGETRRPSSAGDCAYPVFARATPPTPLAFFNAFLPTLASNEDSLRESRGFQLTRAALREMQAELAESGAELKLMYIPHKAELYWQYLDEASRAAIINEAGRDSRLPSLERIDANWQALRHAMTGLTAELGIALLDLTAPLDEAIRAGRQPYFFADTHWNQNGHNIARIALLDFLNGTTLDS